MASKRRKAGPSRSARCALTLAAVAIFGVGQAVPARAGLVYTGTTNSAISFGASGYVPGNGAPQWIGNNIIIRVQQCVGCQYPCGCAHRCVFRVGDRQLRRQYRGWLAYLSHLDVDVLRRSGQHRHFCPGPRFNSGRFAAGRDLIRDERPRAEHGAPGGHRAGRLVSFRLASPPPADVLDVRACAAGAMAAPAVH